MPTTLLVFSHLRWDFVFQRPQHLLTRLARQYKIYFIEEPIYTELMPHTEITAQPAAQGEVQRVRFHTNVQQNGFHDEQIPALREQLQQLLNTHQIHDYATWFYTPMALPLLDGLQPELVIYDCMDELSAFMNAPRQMLQRETALLKRAELVFTGGLSLYRAKCERHPAVHCFPSSVDAAHFARAARSEEMQPSTKDRAARLGFFGVIDERINLPLLAQLAEAHPEWHIELVGPVCKIPESKLPRHDNLHYLGLCDYAELPAKMAAWDVCLLPFALNESTRFISPTKTLEYMAAGKPIVSTPIADVVESHGDIVMIAATTAHFIKACEQALRETTEQRLQRQHAMQRRVQDTSWDSTAERMHALMQAAVTQPNTAATGARISSSSRVSAQQQFDAIVIGAGPTGLSAAYHLGKGSLLLEANATVGGWCRSIYDGGYTFDFAGHIMFSTDPYVHKMYKMLLGDNVHWQDREAWVYSHDVYTRYPFQSALHGLPAQVLKECIVGAIEARFGAIDAEAPVNSAACGGKAESITDSLHAANSANATLDDCCADGAFDSSATHAARVEHLPTRSAPRNFEEFIYKVWGKGVAKHFAIPYNRKLWAIDLKEMETSWLGGRVPLPNLDEMIEGALQPVAKPVGPNARFAYPLRGGFQALMNGFLPLLKGQLELNARVVKVQPLQRTVVLADGRRFAYQQLISTAPLPKLVDMLGDDVPPAVRNAAQLLRHVSVRCVNLGVARTNLTDKHWIYYPGDTVFHRVFVQGNASPHCNPPGGFGLTCEITYANSKPLPCDGDALIERCIDDCVRVGLLNPDDVVTVRNQVDMPYAYVVYDHARQRNFELIRDWVAQFDIVLAGRYSQWQYYNSDHAFLAGRDAAQTVVSRRDELSAVAEALS